MRFCQSAVYYRSNGYLAVVKIDSEGFMVCKKGYLKIKILL